MPSADLYGATLGFLLDDSNNNPGDLRSTVNNEVSSLLGNGSVILARSGRSRAPRRDPSTTAQLEVVPVAPPRPRMVGIGMEERDAALDVKCTLRFKDVQAGAAQITKAKNVVRAIVARYDAVSDLTIPVSGGSADFRYARAEVVDFDEVPDSSELIRSTVRLVFTFTEALAAQ